MTEAPPNLVSTRLALHRLAEEVISPLRVQATGNEIALAVTDGGFGTYELPDGGQLRVEGLELVRRDTDGTERRAPIGSLREAAEFAGLNGAEGLAAEPLDLDPVAVDFLLGFFGFAHRVLEQLRGEAPDASVIHLWPEHFDTAFEAGDEEAGLRANYGASPGDEHHTEPYLYVGPWTARPEGELWGATGFPGAEASYTELLDADDAQAAALDFFRSCRDALAASG